MNAPRFDANRVTRWRCSNCGQLFFTTTHIALPTHCAICHQPTQWQRQHDDLIRWRCPNCGQTLFTSADEAIPELCDYCQDMTTWERL